MADGVRARVDPTRYVPAEVVAQLQAQLATAETANRAGRAEKAVKDAIAAGKLPPAQEAWALAYAAEQPDAFTAFIARQPVLLPPGQQGKDGTPPGGSDVAVLSAEDKAVAKRLGISEQAMLASKAATTKTQEG